MKCKKCGEELNAIAKFCPNCGEKVEPKQYCRECGKELGLSAKFCSSCGTPVREENIQKEKTKVVLLKKNAEVKEERKEDDKTENSRTEDELIEGQETGLNQDNLEEKQEETISESSSGWQMKIGISVDVRTKEDFCVELQQLVQQDKGSKDVVDYYGEKVFIKHVFPILNNNEKILKIRHIVHHNYANTFMRGGVINTKEFLIITNERVIKFVKSFWLKPKIRSCYLSQITAVEETKPGGRLHGIFIGEKLKVNSSVGQIALRTMGRGSAYQVKLDILQAMNENNMETSPAEEKIEDEKDVKNIRYRIGFKWMLFIAFISFFMPFCTVSCGGQTILSANGYELTGNWGMTPEQMEWLEITAADAGNFIIVSALILMVLAFVIRNGKIIKTAQAGIAALLLLVFRNANEWDNIRDVGCQVTFEYGYYIALVSLLLAATAFLWSSFIVEKLENIFVSRKTEAGHFRKKMDVGLSLIIIAVMGTAMFTYYDSLKEWGTIISKPRKVPDLNDDIFADSDYILQDEPVEEIQSKAINDEKSENQWEKTKETASEQEAVLKDNEAVKLAKQYEGEWWDLNSQRCYMDVEAMGGNKVSIVVSWSSGYADDSKWEMAGEVNGRNGRIVYKDCTQYDIHYDEYGGEQKTVHYTNGSGYFYPGNDGYLYWEDEVEGAGAGCYFEKDESIGVQGTTGYTVDVPLGSGTRMYVVECNASITLRNAPSTNAAEITQIPLYAAVDYFGTLDNGFAQVAYNGQLGYVISSYLDFYEPQVYTGIKCQIVNCKQSVTLRTSVETHLYLGKSVPYSGTGALNFGYRDTSFSLALLVVKCQQMFEPAWFRSVSHAASSCLSSSMSAILRVRHCRVMTLSSISAMSSQLPCFGV